MKQTMAKVLEYFVTATTAPTKDSFQTYFIYLAIMIALTGLVAIAVYALYFIITWIQKQCRLRRRMMGIEKIICEAFALESLGQVGEVTV